MSDVDAAAVSVPAAVADPGAGAAPAAPAAGPSLAAARAARRASLEAKPAPGPGDGARPAAAAVPAAGEAAKPPETVSTLLSEVRGAREESAARKAAKQAREEADGLKARLEKVKALEGVDDPVELVRRMGKKLTPDQLVALTDLLEGEEAAPTPAEATAAAARAAALEALEAREKAAKDAATAAEREEQEREDAAAKLYVDQVAASLKGKADKLPALAAVGLDEGVVKACFEDVYATTRNVLDADTMAAGLNDMMATAKWTADTEAAWVGRFARKNGRAPSGREIYRALKKAFETAPEPGQGAPQQADTRRPPTAGVTSSLRRDPGHPPPAGETLDEARARRVRELDEKDPRMRRS